MTSVDLAFTEQGEGPPLVVLHGLFGSSTNWRSAARQLARAHRVLLADMRNHGASPHAPAMDYGSLAADVAALIEQALLERGELARPTVMGHSMGGKAAMRLALDRPELVGALCVVDIAPAPSAHDHSDVIAAMRAVDLGALGGRAAADAALAEHVEDAGLRGFLLQNLRSGPDGFRWRIDVDAIEAAQDDLLAFPVPVDGARYDGPCLFVRGELSDYVLDAHADAIARLFPAAEIRTVRGAGHWVHAERPQAFLDTVEPFLATARHGVG